MSYGVGDVTNRNRQHSVTLKQSLENCIKYCIRNSDGSWYYPFVEDKSFIMYLQDMHERYSIITQANVYMNNNIGDTNISMTELKNPTKRQEIMQKMYKYGANILGSSAYLFRRRIQLEELLKQKGTATIWMTLSFADLHWQDLHRLFGPIPEHINTEELIRKWRNSCLQSNTHVVNDFFVRRVEHFIQEFLGKDGLQSSWHWYRFEWQKRGVVHAHLLAKLHSDPGLTTLGKDVYKGRIAARKLRAYYQVISNNHINHKDEWLHQYAPTDSYLTTWPELIEHFQAHHATYKENDIEKLQQLVNKGLTAENIIVKYRDFILTSINPNNPLPNDASKNERLQKTPFNETHSSSIAYEFHNSSYKINHSNYELLIDQNYRHRCTNDYCLRKGTCRFKFPRELSNVSRISIQELSYKTGPKQNCFRRLSITFTPATNDRWINSHCRIGTTSWGGMLDVQILLDDETVRLYVTKYGTKLEGESKSISNILQISKRISYSCMCNYW